MAEEKKITLEEAADAYDRTQPYKVIPAEAFKAGAEWQKENPKTADSIPSDCVSDAKCEDRWHKTANSLPDNGRDVLAKDALGNYLIAHYDGDQWFISGYDNEDKPIVYTPAIKEWCDIPPEKQQEQPCDTCTNDKGCVTCKDGELWEGKKQPSEELEKYASRAGFDYVDNIEYEDIGHRWNDHDVEYAYRDGIIAGAEWQKEQMRVLIEKWQEHAIRGMMVGNVSYFQGRVALCVELLENLKEDKK